MSSLEILKECYYLLELSLSDQKDSKREEQEIEIKNYIQCFKKLYSPLATLKLSW